MSLNLFSVSGRLAVSQHTGWFPHLAVPLLCCRPELWRACSKPPCLFRPFLLLCKRISLVACVNAVSALWVHLSFLRPTEEPEACDHSRYGNFARWGTLQTLSQVHVEASTSFSIWADASSTLLRAFKASAADLPPVPPGYEGCLSEMAQIRFQSQDGYNNTAQTELWKWLAESTTWRVVRILHWHLALRTHLLLKCPALCSCCFCWERLWNVLSSRPLQDLCGPLRPQVLILNTAL